MKLLRFLSGPLLPIFAAVPAGAAEIYRNNTLALSAIYQTEATGAIEQCSSPISTLCGVLPVIPSGQFHWMSDLDIAFQDFGAKIGATAWYATSSRADYASNRVPIFTYASPGYKYLTVEASDSAQGKIDLSDAYLYDNLPVGGGQKLTVRIGRQTLLWGESRYFIGNGIAAGQAPIDTDLSDTTHYGDGGDIFLPVGQASFSWQPTDNLAIAGYYQFEWRRSVIGSTGGYAGIANIWAPGKKPVIYLSAPFYGPLILLRTPDQAPGSTDQYGASLKWHQGDFDYGVYGLSFNAKTPVFYFHPPVPGTTPPLGTYSLEYPKAIQLYGVSLAGPLPGGASFGAELSVRHRMPLVNEGIAVPPLPGIRADNDTHPLYPLGDTAHAQFSWLYDTPPLSWLPGGAEWSGELAANGVLDKIANAKAITPGRTRYAAAIRTVFEPRFFQVFPHVDLGVPLSLGYNLFGLSETDSTMNRGAGDVGIGVSATIDQVWQTSIDLTHYFGQVRNPLLTMDYAAAGAQFSQSDYVMVSVSRSF